jgi:hypothetical protein
MGSDDVRVHARLRGESEARLSIRVLRGCAMALALLLLMSGLGGSAAALSRAADVVAGATLDCAAHGEDKGRPPLAPCVHCCILCDGCGQFGAMRASIDAPTPRLSPGSEAPGPPLATNSAGALDRRPVGWATSWSSQAPPGLS